MHTKVSIQGNIIEVTHMAHRNAACYAVKVDAGHWVDSDGELHEYESHGETRLDNVQELRKTFKRIRALVNANCAEPARIRWITLTYRENMTDTKRLYRDFVQFWKRYKYRWGHAEYISVVEPQARGAWHIHLIAIHDGKAPYVPNAELAECWGHGFVRVKRVDNCDNLGAYLSAYLADLPVTERDAASSEKTCADGTKKRILKGGRLHLYPVGMNIYRHSRGIKEPEEYWHDSAENVERTAEITERATKTFERVYTWRDDDGRLHEVHKVWYNRVRKPEKGQPESDCWLCCDELGRGAAGASRGDPPSGGTRGTPGAPPTTSAPRAAAR